MLSREDKKKGERNAVSFLWKKESGNTDTSVSIPVCGMINHSPPYLLGAHHYEVTNIEETSEEDERKKECDPS